MKLNSFLPTLLLAIIVVSGCTSDDSSMTAESEKIQVDNEELLALIAETEKDLIMQDGSIIALQDYMEQYNLYGLSVAVYENYQFKWSKTYGVSDLESKTPVDENTVFSTASISKPYTSTLALILEEKGLLNLDAPVNSYLKRWQLPENEFTRETSVTLRHLLTHTAGTTVGGFDDYGVEMEIPTFVQILNGESPAQNDPVVVDRTVGGQWKYSGGGYVIAMLAIEDFTGEKFEDLMSTYILEPLGVKNSTFWQPGSEKFPSNAAAAHNEAGEMYLYKYPVKPELSASGLWSTAEELPLLLIDIQNALAGREARIISPKMAQYMVTEFHANSGFGFSWALFRNWGNLTWFSFNGANTGIGGQVAATMDGGNAIAILGNGPNSIRVPMIEMLSKRIAETHGWARPAPEALSDEQ